MDAASCCCDLWPCRTGEDTHRPVSHINTPQRKKHEHPIARASYLMTDCKYIHNKMRCGQDQVDAVQTTEPVTFRCMRNDVGLKFIFMHWTWSLSTDGGLGSTLYHSKVTGIFYVVLSVTQV